LKRMIVLQVNDETCEVPVEPQTTLLQVLRDQLDLTGTKEGCGTGECGSCTVLLEGKPVLSCLALAVDCVDHEVVTIEGLGRGGKLDPVQRSFLECGAVQCGFCTPGMVLSTKALLAEKPRPSEGEIIKHSLRCAWR